MLKLELFFADRLNLVWIKRFYYYFIATLLSSIKISFSYLILIPIGKIIIKMSRNKNVLNPSKNINENIK